MAISITDFGSSVEEVQQKLGDLLPLLEAGGEKINNLQNDGEMSNRDGGPFGIFLDLKEKSMHSSEVAGHIHTNCVTMNPDLNEAFVKVKEQLVEDLKLADEADPTFNSAQETLDDELHGSDGKIRQTAATFETTLNHSQEKISSLTLPMTSMKTSFASARESVLDKLNEGISQNNVFHSELAEELKTFENEGYATINQSGLGPLMLFEGAMSGMVEAVEAKMTGVRNELDGMLDALRLDRRTMWSVFGSGLQGKLGLMSGMFSTTADKVFGDLESCKGDTLERLDSEITAAQAASEKAKALLDDVTPKLTGVAEAKRTAEDINQAM